MSKKVYIDLDRPGRYLFFSHELISSAVQETNKSIGDLLNDTFFGWQVLMHKGLMTQDKTLTRKQASKLIDVWCEKGNTLEDLGKKIIDALRACGYFKDETPPEDAEGAEGNAPPPE